MIINIIGEEVVEVDPRGEEVVVEFLFQAAVFEFIHNKFR
jgi:hypothetical protein